MARRWGDPTAFRPDPNAAPESRPSWRQSLALLVALVVVAGVVSAVSYLVQPDRARSFDLLHGSVLIADQFGPVSIDLGTGKGTLQIRGASDQVDAKPASALQLVPFDDGTLLVNQRTGEFNMVDSTGFTIKRDGGVPIDNRRVDATATGIAAGHLAYVERSAASGTEVLLVSPATVSTAATALKSSRAVKPRASYTSQDVGVTAEGGAASANGALWALFKTAAGPTVLRRLVTPPNSSIGAALRQTNQVTVDALSAVESATADADGSGGDVVGVASPGRVRVISPSLTTRTLTYRTPAGLDTIVPTTQAQGRLSWLLHGSDGWSLLSVPTVAGSPTGPVPLRTIDPDARLAPAAQSSGELYTMLRSGTAGSIYRIGVDGRVVAVRAEYPQKRAADGKGLESAPFTDGYLVARGSRVIVDSPGHYLALTVFTDGSHAPVVIEKTNLTSVNAASGADALTQGVTNNNPGTPPPGDKTTKPTVAPQINNKINCKQVSQKPHVPQISAVNPSARSVGLTWTYPILDSQDCNPSTYVVSVRLLSNNAPPAPGSVTLQNHLDAVIAGLYPSTQYEFTVTAYINGQSTPSLPVRVTTGKEGPAAPTGIQVSADSAGDWNLSWNGCGSVASKCVQTDSWTVRPYFCDSRGLSGSPAALTAPADPSSVGQPPTVYKGGDALLGRALQFRIQGTGTDGTAGDVSAASACVQSWSPPTVSAMTLSASQTSATSSTASVDLDLGSNPTHNAGGVGATVTFTLSGGGTSQTRTVTYNGNGSKLASSFSGLQPGYQYSVTARVSPPGHPGSAQTTSAQQITTRADWPTLGVSAACPSGGGFHISCDLTVNVSGVSSGSAHGERFSFTDDSGLYCGNAGYSFNTNGAQRGFDPASYQYTTTISQLASGFSGNCAVRVHLVETGAPDPQYFGGTTSGPASTSLDLDAASTLGADSGDFSAAWNSGGGAVVKYTGSYTDTQLSQLSNNWNSVIIAPDGSQCGNTSNPPTHGGITVPLDANCLNAQGDKSGWSVKISYTENANGNTGGGTESLSGTPPGYVPPCVLGQSNFAAAWNTDAMAPAATVTFDGTGTDLRGCSALTYQLVETQLLGGKDCGTATAAGSLPDTAPGAVALPLGDACSADRTNGLVSWGVKVSWTSQRDGAKSATISVSGSPPN